MTPTRRRMLATGVATVGTGLVGCLGSDETDAITIGEDFETGLDEWETDGHVGPDADGTFEWSIDRSRERARGGEWSLAISTEGRFDDGTAWATRPIDVEAGRSYHAEATIPAWSGSESFNVVRHLVAYLGSELPAAEGDFPQPGQNSTDFEDAPAGGLREPLDLAAGWHEYTFEWTSPELATDTLYFAVGNAVVWETDRTHYTDDLELALRLDG